MTENEILGLEDEIQSLEFENSQLKRRLEEYLAGEAESKKKIDKCYRDAENYKRASMQAYAMELKALKAFSDKWRRVVSSDLSKTENSEIIDLLQGFLSDIGIETAKQTVGKIDEKLNEDKAIMPSTEETEPFEFDLDAALNPSGDLDLADLCKELGVYRG